MKDGWIPVRQLTLKAHQKGGISQVNLSKLCCAPASSYMQTLSDPDARAMYDAIAGFSVESVNPFVDTSFPADQVFVDEVRFEGGRGMKEGARGGGGQRGGRGGGGGREGQG